MLVKHFKVFQRIDTPLISCHAKPVRRFCVVVRYAMPQTERSSDSALSHGKPLIRGASKPLNRYLVVLRDAFAIAIGNSQLDLRGRLSVI